MSELEDWIEKNLPEPSKRSGNTFEQKSADKAVTDFYKRAAVLHVIKIENSTERTVLSGLKDSANGANYMLSQLLTEDKYFESLTPIHRKAIAWVLRNSASSKPDTRNQKALKEYTVIKAAAFHGWNDYPKDKAIELAALDCLLLGDKYSQLIYENVPEKYWGVISWKSLEAIKNGLSGISDCDFDSKLRSRYSTIYRDIGKKHKSTFEKELERIEYEKKRLESWRDSSS